MITIKKNVEIPFIDQDNPLRGDLVLGQHNPGAPALLLLTEEGVEVLSTYVAEIWEYLSPEHIVIKDYSEHTGLALRLQDAGAVKIVGQARIGPFNSRVIVVTVNKD